MNQKEAIAAAREKNKQRDKHEPILEFVAMDEDGLWFGYDEEPDLDEDFDEWSFHGWKVPLDSVSLDWKLTKVKI